MKKFLLLLVIIPLCSCATTRTYGYLDPDYQNNYKVSKIIVSFKGVTLDEVFKLEDQMVQKLSAYNVKVIKYTDIIPPTKNYTDDEWINKIKETGADALLVINVSRDSVSTYVPETYYPGRTTSQVNTFSNNTYVSTYTSPGYTSGGYEVSAPIMFTVSSLIDVQNGNTIWKAETSGSGDELTSFSKLLELTCDDIVADMNDKELFKSNHIKLSAE